MNIRTDIPADNQLLEPKAETMFKILINSSIFIYYIKIKNFELLLELISMPLLRLLLLIELHLYR